jgi:flagella basal body P-ring formation protein FlgA
MSQSMRPITIVLLAIVALAARPLAGAELQLRARCQPRGAVVTLGDVAEVVAADPRQAEPLVAIELFSAPAPGQQRVVRLADLQDLLNTRQINLAEHRFSGASQVVIEGRGEAPSAPKTPLSPSVRKRAERLVSEAIVRFLQKVASGGAIAADRQDANPDRQDACPTRQDAGPTRQDARPTWNVEVALSDAQARTIPADGTKIAIHGGEPPWTGSQQFEVAAEAREGTWRFTVRADVAARQPVVVAAVALARGAVVRASDVQVVPASAVTDSTDATHTLDEVVGKEATRAVAAGTVVQATVLRAPVIIHRGDVITVYSRSPGIRVRTEARAREEGGVGDLISVESLSERKKVFSARVSGIQEAEVYARAVQSAPQMQRISSSLEGSAARSDERSWR